MINDTICAVSTPPGTGGIAVIRISGPEAIEVAQKLWHGKHLASVESHTAHLGTLHTLESDDDLLDQGVATVFRGPRSFTGEDVVELSVHGSPYLQSELIRQLSKAGARIAMPGEFTRRAFVAGRFDLAEAEAVADLIASTSKTAHRLAMSQMRGDLSAELTRLRESLIELASLLELELDFSEEQVEFASRKELLRQTDVCLNILGELQRSYISAATLREGLPVALIGPTNAGKSSLLNALSSSNRAIVSDIPGTTRDIIDTLIDIDGTLFRLIDTAGLRVTDDPVEAIGIDRARQAAATAHVILLLTDPLTDETVERTAERYNEAKALAGDQSTIIPVLTKSDLADDNCIVLWKERLAAQGIPSPIVVSTEADHRHTLQPLREAILKTVPFAEGAPDQVILTNARHLRQIELATDALQSTREGLKQDIPADLVAQDLRAALHHLGEITGTISAPDLLSTIFSRFCIGK